MSFNPAHSGLTPQKRILLRHSGAWPRHLTQPGGSRWRRVAGDSIGSEMLHPTPPRTGNTPAAGKGGLCVSSICCFCSSFWWSAEWHGCLTARGKLEESCLREGLTAVRGKFGLKRFNNTFEIKVQSNRSNSL